jgi:hypothetical protein
VCVPYVVHSAVLGYMCSDIYRRGEPEHVNDNIQPVTLSKAETCDGAPVPLYCTCWRVKNKSTYSHSIIRYRTRPKFPVRLLLMCPAALLLLNLKPYSFIRFELHAPRSKA